MSSKGTGRAWRVGLGVLAAAVILGGCSGGAPASAKVRLVIAGGPRNLSEDALSLWDRLMAPPARATTMAAAFSSATSVYDFSCWAVNITGEGIPFARPELGSVFSTGGTDGCSYPGITSAVFGPLGEGEEAVIELDVPPGSDRFIQVLGIEALGGCPGGGEPFADVMAGDLDLATAQFQTFSAIETIGVARADIFDETTVTVENSFVPGGSNTAFCAAGGGTTPPGAEPLSPDVIPGLVAWYQVDGDYYQSGNEIPAPALTDFAGGFNDLASSGGAQPLIYDSVAGGRAALAFTGSTSEMHMNGPTGMPAGDLPVSMVAVIYPAAAAAMEVLALGDYALPAESVKLGVSSGSTVFGMYGGNLAVSAPVMSINQWYVIAGTYGGPSNPYWVAYVDGGSAGVTTEGGTPYIDPMRISMGMFVDLSTGPFAGYIAEAMIYDVELTQAQVQGLTAYLKGFYSF